jgi:valyl-tRNA synthetase
MMGDKVSWIPGTDHAGISTQTVVEKRLQKTEQVSTDHTFLLPTPLCMSCQVLLWNCFKVSRHDLGRETFLERVQEWKEHRLHDIVHQMVHIFSFPFPGLE